MSRLICRALLALVVCGALQLCFSASPAIGLVVANGSFQLERSQVWGNATLFDGNVLETNVSSSQLQLQNGVNLRLAAESRARVFQNRLVLEKGIGQLESVNYPIEAATLRVTTGGSGAIARVQVAGPNKILVAARQGDIRVNNREGVLVARLEAGSEMSFEPQAPGSPTQVSGCLLRKGGKLVVADKTTHVTMEVQGPGLEAEVGNHVAIVGTPDAAAPTVAGASQLVNVTSVKRLAKGGCAGAAAAIGAAGAAGAAGAGAGISSAATVAIVGGVAAVGTVAGLAAAGELPGQGGGKPPASK